MAGLHQWRRWLIAGVIAATLSGCASIPDAIKGTSSTPQQNLARVMAAPQLYIGQEARFGGKVVNVVNENSKTRLEIATVPLDYAARPTLGIHSRGRIYADIAEFLDPVDFRHQLVTVVGPIIGTVKNKIGELPYTFVLIRAIGYKRWNVIQQVVMPPLPPQQPIDPWCRGLGSCPHRYGYGGREWYGPWPATLQTILID